METSVHRTSCAAAALLLASLAGCSETKVGAPPVKASAPPQYSYASPEEAIHLLGQTAGSGDTMNAGRLFGFEGLDMLRSGDDVADHDDALAVKALIAEKVAFEQQEDGSQIALLGNDGWAFPIPLVPIGGRWRFDVAAGREELENRRVGRNELYTIATLHAYVDAQREYASRGHDGFPPCYAQYIFSSPGLHDGLYWPAAEGEDESPFGPQVAEAAEDGYEQGAEAFHGYVFRLLTSRGARASGGAKDYLDENGLMTGGFAMLAWPLKYGSSGVMTFLVSDRGMVFQKDLGMRTEELAAEITAYQVDDGWEPSED